MKTTQEQWNETYDAMGGPARLIARQVALHIEQDWDLNELTTSAVIMPIIAEYMDLRRKLDALSAELDKNEKP